MNDSYDRLLSAREDLGLLLSGLSNLSGQLEEVATTARRAGLAELGPGLHRGLQDATGRLAATLHSLAEAGTDQPPSLAFCAVAQLGALESDVAAAAAAAEDSSPALTAALTVTLQRVRSRLWSFISHLVRIKEWSLTAHVGPVPSCLAPEGIRVTFS
jgi:hypothetical protein